MYSHLRRQEVSVRKSCNCARAARCGRVMALVSGQGELRRCRCVRVAVTGMTGAASSAGLAASTAGHVAGIECDRQGECERGAARPARGRPPGLPAGGHQVGTYPSPRITGRQATALPATPCRLSAVLSAGASASRQARIARSGRFRDARRRGFHGP
jgi:hypothetical protein